MFLSFSVPRSLIGASMRPPIRSMTAADTSTPPVGAYCCSRDTMLMPSPSRSVPSTVTSPMWMAQRSFRRMSRSGAILPATAWISSAARVASTGLVNSTSRPSPSDLKMRPPPCVISGSISRRSARHAASALSSLASTMVLKPTTSKAATTTSRRLA